MRHFIEHHFGIILLLSCLAGLIVPGLDLLPNQTAIVVLALLMFNSCYRLRDGGFNTVRWHNILYFYALRYLLLPIALWLIARTFAPDYAIAVFLLSVVPAGVASPAFASIYGGVAAPGFAIVIVSQLVTPFLIPLQFALIGNTGVTPSPIALFITMVWCIFVPMAVYAIVRKHKVSAHYIYGHNKLFSMLLVAFIIALAIAKQRDILLTHLPALGHSLIITVLCFSCYIVFGGLIMWRRPRAERITYATCSGFNNAALGVSLALMHFSPDVILFVAVSEIAWSMLPLMMRVYLRA